MTTIAVDADAARSTDQETRLMLGLPGLTFYLISPNTDGNKPVKPPMHLLFPRR
jgi:hypothetical protein